MAAAVATAGTTILAIVIAVLIDKYAQDLPGGNAIIRYRTGAWLNAYLNKMLEFAQRFNFKQNYGLALWFYVPLCIALWILKLIFAKTLGVIGVVLFSAFALLYFLGNDLALEEDSGFISAHEQSFGVLFWFAILGPQGALLYWFLVISKQAPILMDPAYAEVRTLLTWLHAIIAWIPARITGFVYALVGNFTSGFNAWLGCIRRTNMQSSQMLEECGRAAVDSSLAEDDVNLVTRAFVAWVILSIIIVFIIK